jgi:hypothetical protein
MTLNGEKLNAGDQARLTDVTNLEIAGERTSEIILIDLP